MTPVVRKWGWKPDLPDHRDHVFAVPPTLAAALPPKVDLTSKCPKTIYDQGGLGSCTGNAIAAAFEFDVLKQHGKDFMPSRLFIYFNERSMEGTIKEDAGAMIRDGVKSVKKLGVCPETMWPYSDKAPGPFQEKPSDECYKEALRHQVKTYERIPRSLRAMRTCLHSGYPFVFGFSVYEGFMSDAVAKTGVAQLPKPSEDLLGGHAVLAVGYDDEHQRFIVRNSWGPGWGKGGYFTLPYGYMSDEDLSDDFWTLRTVEAPKT